MRGPALIKALRRVIHIEQEGKESPPGQPLLPSEEAESVSVEGGRTMVQVNRFERDASHKETVHPDFWNTLPGLADLTSLRPTEKLATGLIHSSPLEPASDE